MKQTPFTIVLLVACLTGLSCKKGNGDPAPQPPPFLTDLQILRITPEHGPKDTKVTVTFHRYLNAEELPDKLYVGGVLIPFTLPSPPVPHMDFIVPAGMKSGQIQVEWKGKMINGPVLTYDSLYYVSTIAGRPGVSGGTDGPAASALFNKPGGVAIDKAGNIYVCERWNHRIRKINTAGVVSTLAGNGTAGYAEGQGTAARFNEPKDLAVDNNGYVYVTDRSNSAVRKISPDGTTSTLASGLFDPMGIDIDQNGVVYITAGMKVIKISAAGQVTELAGSGWYGDVDGTGANAQFSNPNDVAINNNGDLFVCDAGSNKIRKVTQAGVVTSFAGTRIVSWGYADGQGAAARFGNPTSLVADGDNTLYVLEYTNGLVRVITPDAMVGTFAGIYNYFGHQDGLARKALFHDPLGIATDKKGTFYIADHLNHCIRKISRE
jgi:sugar lactone lactonase YvrE